MHVHGGTGIDIDGPLHRYFVAAKRNEFALGSATAQLRRLGAELAATPPEPATVGRTDGRSPGVQRGALDAGRARCRSSACTGCSGCTATGCDGSVAIRLIRSGSRSKARPIATNSNPAAIALSIDCPTR